MERQRRWQLAIILTVLAWTVYNILPTVIFYSKSRDKPVQEAEAKGIEREIIERVNGLEQDSVEWIQAFCSMIGVSPSKITVDEQDPATITFNVASPHEAALVQKFLPRAGLVIPNKPAQLLLGEVQGQSIRVIRRLGIRLHDHDFQYIRAFENDSKPSQDYFNIVAGRFADVVCACSGPSDAARDVEAACLSHDKQALERIASDIAGWASALPPGSALPKRLMRSLFSGDSPATGVATLISQFAQEVTQLNAELATAQKQQKEALAKGAIAPHALVATEKKLQERIHTYQDATQWLEKQQGVSFPRPITKQEVLSFVEQSRTSPSTTVTFALEGHNPVIQAAMIDWEGDTIRLYVYPDVAATLTASDAPTEQAARANDTIKTFAINEIARISRKTREDFKNTSGAYYCAALSQAPSTQGRILLSLKNVVSSLSSSLLAEIAHFWQPAGRDFSSEALPRLSIEQYVAAPTDVQKLCLVVLSPKVCPQAGFQDLKAQSLYVIIRGGLPLLAHGDSIGAGAELKKDLDRLASMLQQRGFVGYSGRVFGPASELSDDIIFELENFYEPLLEATREAFYVPGSATVAVLECGTVEDRILAENHIDDALQEELMKWKESWQSAQVSLNPVDHFSVPKPTKSVFWSNIKRSWKKYWRGDETRIIKWGLDLSGGKSVRVGLVDQANRPVTRAEDLRQASSELYSRLNKMGVSERTLRIENGTVMIDFPGVRGVSASELIKASAMYFHVVNEQFGPLNTDLAKPVQAFLQDVWNEAIVSNAKDSESINRIALSKVSAVASGLASDDAIRALLDAGLVLEDPSSPPSSSSFDDRVSTLARWAGDDPSTWPSPNNPLVIVFKNYALEGCSLENVNPSYDPSKGNILAFGVRKSDPRNGTYRPQDEFYTWTSQFSEEGILGTPREHFSRGRGWRMAVILNGAIVSAPTLSSGLRDSAVISGNFSQSEVQRLATNLQAGSLSFTPKILSEQNVSPELGARDRSQGLVAAVLSVVAVVAIMVGYYRFAGAIASLAVLFNLLIIWAVMQNIEAAMTLPAIAGIVLTVAMAVDANVLVFERIREEFALSRRISSAIDLGYEKAFSAIVDSNLTTLIAAFILTQFDCGPVRGFALTLIIGLTSSMFTSLFVTKYYFVGWARRPGHTELSMANWIQSKNFDFLAWKRPAIILSAALLIAGTAVSVYTWKSMLGMDFTGGYALVLEASTSPETTPKEAAERALIAHGVQPSEIQIRELGRPTALRIQLSASLEEPGRPLNGLPPQATEATTFEYQTVPQLNWVVTTLEQGGLQIRASDKPALSQQWNAISGQFSDAMRNNALLALALSIIAVLIYIAVRFEWKYAVSAVLALIHDVVLTLAVVAILRLVGLHIQVNVEMIGALMTIIGYSLNDTIIVFDRVREDINLYRKKKFSDIVNLALNSTLSRTIMTSGITLAVLLLLTLLGGPSIFGFSFVMFMGVFLGTLSSLFIAGPLLVFFHNREDQ